MSLPSNKCIQEKIVDLHMHSTVSDGTDDPKDLIGCVKDAKIDIFSLTDHDAIKGCKYIKECLKEDDPLFINGIELSCKDELGKYHILGYNYDINHQAINDIVNKGHSLRMKKVKARIDFLRDEFNFVFTDEELDELFKLDNPGKPHIANLMIAHGYAIDKQDAIANYINKLRMKSEYVRPEEAIKAILDSGGIPVLAHPFFGSGDQLIVGEEMEERLKHLLKYNLKGIECFYSGFTPKLIKQALDFASKYNLYVTAGSDYHGKNKLVELADTGSENYDMPQGMSLFLNEVINNQK